MRKQNEPPSILCAGIAVQDIVMQVEAFPAPGAKVSASEFVVTGGGCAANAAVAVARLGGRTRFSGPLGAMDDAVSARVVHDLEADGIDCSGVVRVPGATASVSLILLDAAGEKTIATRRGQGLDRALPRDAEAAVRGIDALLIDNRFPEYVTALARAAKARGVRIVIDFDLATTADDPLLALGDYIIASAEALHGMTGTRDFGAALTRLAAHNRGFLAATDGPNGVYWLENGALRHMPAFTIKAVDSLGAGDVFHGAFTLAMSEGRSMADALRFGSAAAALKCLRFGGTVGAPTRAEVEDFIKARPAS